MRLAWAEIRRAKLRFGALTGAIALLVFLIFFQQSLSGSLLSQFTGGLEHQSASVLVYSADARRSVDGSRVTPDQMAAVSNVDGVAAMGPIGESVHGQARGRRDQRHHGVRVRAGRGRGSRRPCRRDVCPRLTGRPWRAPPTPSAGYAIGQRLTVLPGGVTVTVVGQADDTQFNVQPTLFVSWPDLRGPRPFDESRRDRCSPQPGGRRADVGGRSRLPGRDDHGQVEGVEALDRATAVASLPGVASIQQSFAIILGLAFVVVILLTGFFFLIITVQKTASLTLLRAVGAGSWFLLRNLLFQVLLVIAAALVIAIPLTIFCRVGGRRVAAFAATTDPSVLLITSTSIVILGVLASVGAMRRLTKIDPAAATARMAGGGLA